MPFVRTKSAAVKADRARGPMGNQVLADLARYIVASTSSFGRTQSSQIKRLSFGGRWRRRPGRTAGRVQ